MCDQEIHSATLHATPFADADSGEDRHECDGHCAEDYENGIQDACLGHDPATSQKDDDAEDVDETGGEYAVPGSEQHWTLDKEICAPPGREEGGGFVITYTLSEIRPNSNQN